MPNTLPSSNIHDLMLLWLRVTIIYFQQQHGACTVPAMLINYFQQQHGACTVSEMYF